MPKWMEVVVNIIADNLKQVVSSTIIIVSQQLAQLNTTQLDVRNFLQKLPCGCDLDTDLIQGMCITAFISTLPAIVWNN